MAVMRILDGLQSTDMRLFFRVQRYQPVLQQACRQLSRTADGPLYAILPLLYWAFDADAGWPLVLLVATAFAIERPLYYLLKKSFRRRRPPAAIPGFTSVITASDEFSFPSGHTCGAFLFTSLLCLYGSWWFVPLYVWASMVGLSRVVLGVHFPGDVIVGALIGVAIGFAVGWS